MTFNHKLFTIIPALLLLLSACAPAATPAPAPTNTPDPNHWTYDGEEGPEHWGALSPDFALCETGKRQSPIDLNDPAQQKQDLANIVFHYKPSKINILNNGHTIQVNYDSGSYIEVDGVRYDLVQFHFHAPSEHSLKGKLAEAELHLVHKNAEGKLAVVGVLIEEGEPNSAIQPVWDNLPAKSGPVQTLDAQVDASQLLPAVQTTYRYDGSLTTPPCSEDVKWMVMTDPIIFSTKQVIAFVQLFPHHNNRPIQPLNGRVEIEDTSP
jgi:carbonic anhydrase